MDCLVTTDPVPLPLPHAHIPGGTPFFSVTLGLISSRGSVHFSTLLNLDWPCLLWPIERGESEVAWVPTWPCSAARTFRSTGRDGSLSTWGSEPSLQETERPMEQNQATTASTSDQTHEGGQLRLPAQPTSQLHAAVWVNKNKTSRGIAQPTHRRMRDNKLLFEGTKFWGWFVTQY